MFTVDIPTAFPEQSCPPTTRMRPSDNDTMPAQNMSLVSFRSSTGTEVNSPVVGCQTRADEDPMHSGPPSHVRTCPVLSITMLIATRGQSFGWLHDPWRAGSPVVNDQLSEWASELP